MKKEILFVGFLLLLLIIPLASSEIIITRQIQGTYNLGDMISVPVTIKTASGVSGFFNMDLLCGGTPINFFKNTISLSPGEEKRMDSSLALIKEVIGELKGNCKIKAYLGDEYIITPEFKISKLINMNIELSSSEFSPGEVFLLEGRAVNENGKDSNGFVELSILDGNSTILNQVETIQNGFFSINISLDDNMKAGQYFLKLNAYETNSLREKTNEGVFNKNIKINQIPTSLEIFFDFKDVEPGTLLKVKAILYDQSGEKISSLANLTIKDSKNKIVEKVEIMTDELFEFFIKLNELPSKWVVEAVSEGFSLKSNFNILSKEGVSLEILNTTLIVTNTGNVPYNKSVLVNIGNDSLYLDVYLDVGKSQEYILTAPDGIYKVEVITDEVSSESNGVALTGKSVDVRKVSNKIMKYRPTVWVFVIFILGFMTFMMFQKGYRKTFIGYMKSKISRSSGMKEEKNRVSRSHSSRKDSLISSQNRADISLSIKGEKQVTSVISLYLKNFDELLSKKNEVKDTFQSIVSKAESLKAVINESGNTLFFILSPTKTKTFKNEKDALDIAIGIKEILKNHNKIFRQKISFGISINCGEIISKQEGGLFKFIAFGSLMTISKKIASLTNEDILLSEKMNNNLVSYIKTTKNELGGLSVYSIKEIKNSEEHNKFLKKFLERQDKK